MRYNGKMRNTIKLYADVNTSKIMLTMVTDQMTFENGITNSYTYQIRPNVKDWIVKEHGLKYEQLTPNLYRC